MSLKTSISPSQRQHFVASINVSFIIIVSRKTSSFKDHSTVLNILSRKEFYSYFDVVSREILVSGKITKNGNSYIEMLMSKASTKSFDIQHISTKMF